MSAGRFVCMVWCSFLAASCSSPLLPESDPTFVRRILAADPGPFLEQPDLLFTILVDSDPPEPEPLEECAGRRLLVWPSTRIADSRGGKTIRATTSVLEEGALVRVWSRGLIVGCPATTAAEAIERLE